MRNLSDKRPNSKIRFRLLMLVAGFCTVVALTPRSTATATLTISVVNNSGLEIRHLYLSPADNDDWGPDHLNETAIASGTTRNVQVSWDLSTVKLVAEDQDGCFFYKTVEATGSPVWTIASDAPRDCGE